MNTRFSNAPVVAECAYGENAWQTPAQLRSFGTDDPLALDKFQVLAGTMPSYNNWCDIDRLLQTATHIQSVYDADPGGHASFDAGYNCAWR